MEPGDPISRLSDGVFCPPIAWVGFSAILHAVFAVTAQTKERRMIPWVITSRYAHRTE